MRDGKVDMVKLTFDDKWMKAYWAEIEPAILQNLDVFEAQEKWVKHRENYIESLNQVASNLPQIANLPLDPNAETIASSLLEILYFLPIKTCLAAFSWLAALSEHQHRWSTICQVFATRQISTSMNVEKPSAELIYSQTLIKRLQLFCWLKELEITVAHDATLQKFIRDTRGNIHAQ